MIRFANKILISVRKLLIIAENCSRIESFRLCCDSPLTENTKKLEELNKEVVLAQTGIINLVFISIYSKKKCHLLIICTRWQARGHVASRLCCYFANLPLAKVNNRSYSKLVVPKWYDTMLLDRWTCQCSKYGIINNFIMYFFFII